MIIRIYGAAIMIAFIVFGMGLHNVPAFIDIPSLLIVLGGTIAGLMMSIDLKTWVDLSKGIVRPHTIENMEELERYTRSFEMGSRFAIGIGMTGTLIGLILMLGNMSDIESIGPNMAVALICALYGVVLSELIFQPAKNWLISIAPIVNDDKKRELMKREHAQWQLLLLGGLLPILGLFILLLNFSSGESKPLWDRPAIVKMKVSQLSISRANKIKIAQKEHSWDEFEIKEGNFRCAFESLDDKYSFKFDFEQFINKKEVSLFINFNHQNDSLEISNYEFFQYPVLINGRRNIILERDGYKIDMIIDIESNIDEKIK